MGEPIVGITGHPHYDHTDENLRFERDKFDVSMVEARQALEEDAEEVLRTLAGVTTRWCRLRETLSFQPNRALSRRVSPTGVASWSRP